MIEININIDNIDNIILIKVTINFNNIIIATDKPLITVDCFKMFLLFQTL